MEIVKLPRPIRWFWASLGAYWLGERINAGFIAVAIMALIMIVILFYDAYFPPTPDTEDQIPPPQ